MKQQSYQRVVTFRVAEAEYQVFLRQCDAMSQSVSDRIRRLIIADMLLHPLSDQDRDTLLTTHFPGIGMSRAHFEAVTPEDIYRELNIVPRKLGRPRKGALPSVDRPEITSTPQQQADFESVERDLQFTPTYAKKRAKKK